MTPERKEHATMPPTDCHCRRCDLLQSEHGVLVNASLSWNGAFSTWPWPSTA
jgi:hypothetical protein